MEDLELTVARDENLLEVWILQNTSPTRVNIIARIGRDGGRDYCQFEGAAEESDGPRVDLDRLILLLADAKAELAARLG